MAIVSLARTFELPSAAESHADAIPTGAARERAVGEVVAGGDDGAARVLVTSVALGTTVAVAEGARAEFPFRDWLRDPWAVLRDGSVLLTWSRRAGEPSAHQRIAGAGFGFER